MATFATKTISEDELTLLLEQMDGWDAEDDLQVEQLTDGFLCRFTFPDGNPREDKVLGYVHANAAVWHPVKDDSWKDVFSRQNAETAETLGRARLQFAAQVDQLLAQVRDFAAAAAACAPKTVAGLIVELAAEGLEVSFTPYEEAPTLLVRVEERSRPGGSWSASLTSRGSARWATSC